MTKQYFVMCEHNNSICGEHESVIGRASTVKTAKAIIHNCKKDNGIYVAPHNFRIFDCFAEIDAETGFVPCVYRED